jgi:plastocyanin
MGLNEIDGGNEMKALKSLTLSLLMFVAAGCFLGLSAISTRQARDTNAVNNVSQPPLPRHEVPSPAATSKPATTQILIDNFSFHPPILTVPVGAQVTWINHDDAPHTATSSEKPRAFDSGSLDTDEKYSRVFTTPGIYDYFCAVHPHMTGRIVVN